MKTHVTFDFTIHCEVLYHSPILQMVKVKPKEVKNPSKNNCYPNDMAKCKPRFYIKFSELDIYSNSSLDQMIFIQSDKCLF